MNALRILVVDDHPTNRKLLKVQLEAEGHAVLEADNGIAALEVLETNTVDAIISDILMPLMDGYHLCAEVRRQPELRDLPFIFYTATYTSPADEELCYQLGADKYLRKPLSVHDLLQAVADARTTQRRRPTVSLDAEDVTREYSARLVTKLEEKNAELAAASGQLRLNATALDIAPDAILITDAHGLITWVNKTFCAVMDCEPEEAIGRSPVTLGIPAPDGVFTRGFWEHHPPDFVWRGQLVRRRDGSPQYDELTVTAVREPGGTITHFVGLLHDVTERTIAEERLRDANAQLREFVDHSPAVLYALRIEGSAVVPRLVSENITRLLGYEVNETLRPDWWLEQVHPEDRARVQAGIAQSISAGGVHHSEYRVRHKNGTYRWVEDHRRSVRDVLGQPLELVGAMTDVSERRIAQDELRESERRFRNMLDNLELIAMMLDPDARITYCNDHLLRLTGWRREEILGQSWIEIFIPAEDRNDMRAAFQLLMQDAPEGWHHENEILARSGQRRLIQWNNSVLRSASGAVIGTASIGEDVTERRNLERQILRAQRLESLGTLAGGIAHDLNNLLMPILMGATLLKRLDPTPRARKVLDDIEGSVRRGSELVKQVLLFARGAETARAAVDMKQVIREVAGIARRTFPKDITLDIEIADRLHCVSGDATQLTQVVLNLCVNARDAMPRGGTISISAENEEMPDRFAELQGAAAGGAFVVLEVADTGEGMSKETIDRIFDPFFTTKPVGQGTGLGLSTVQGIVSSHGGFVVVFSTPGEGSSFKVHLPAVMTGEEVAAGSTQPEPGLPTGHGELILVVDDDASVARMTREALESFGYHVITADHGAQAIGIYSRRHSEIAIVITDMAMPVIDGFALIAAMTTIDANAHAIATTGNTSAAALAKIHKAGVAGVLKKPYTTDQLLRIVAEALARNAGNAAHDGA